MAGLGVVKRSKSEVTLEELQKRFPGKAKTIDEKTVELINQANSDENFNGDEFITAMYDYENVMYKNKASIKEYITALKFCAYLEAENDSYTEAYKKARATDEFVIARMDASTDSPEYRELTNAASRYRKTPLVRDILVQADMPLYLMFQGQRYKAVKVLADEMLTASYSKDRINAADKLLTHVKPPENLKIDMDIGMSEATSSAVQDLNAQLAQLAANQKKHLEAGSVDLEYFGNMKVQEDVIEAEVE